MKPYSKMFKKAKRPNNKFNSKVQTYKGRSYHSTLEANYARKLDLLIKAKEVKKWEPQFKIPLGHNGIHFANYFIDFKVWMSDGTIEYHEVKGLETDLWKLKWKMTQAFYPEYKLVLIKKV